MKKVFSSLIILSGLTVSAADTTTAKATDTPFTVCQAIVESAKNKDFEGMQKWTTDMSAHHKKMKMNKADHKKMSSQYFEKMQDLTCGKEIVAQDHAIVESESNGQKRLIPFIKKGDGWKFDQKTYHSFYGDEGHHSKKHSHKM